jgi:hypothetical protein
VSTTGALHPLEQSLFAVRFDNAEFFARDLFEASFGAPFPVPPPDNATTRAWHQYVAFYRWSATSYEPVGFCNWIRRGDAYLEGGMCVRRGFYRRLPPGHFAQCKARGGVAQIMMEAAARELDDAAAWFGYCGDKQAYRVDSRVGYEPTRHPFLIVKWFRELDPRARDALVEEIAAIGPF